MSVAQNIVRPEIRALSAYHVPDASGLVKLDAMENPYLLPPDLQRKLGEKLGKVALNRYPVPSYAALKAAIHARMGVPQGFGLVLGNGSDELISIVSVACAKPGAKVLAPLPGFVMYAMSAQFAGLEFVGVPLTAGFQLDLPAMLDAIRVHKPAVTYLAYPNNPTGALFDEAAMVEIIEAVGDSGVVVVDEAYQPFAGGASFMGRLPEFANLVVMRTVSKLGLAGIRQGYLSAAPALLRELDKVRPPYNVNMLTEAAALFVLEHLQVLAAQAAQLREARSVLATELAALEGVEVFPSAANFILIRVPDADKVCAALLARRVLVKNAGRMHVLLQNCLRITVSTDEENAIFLTALKDALREQ